MLASDPASRLDVLPALDWGWPITVIRPSLSCRHHGDHVRRRDDVIGRSGGDALFEALQGAGMSAEGTRLVSSTGGLRSRVAPSPCVWRRVGVDRARLPRPEDWRSQHSEAVEVPEQRPARVARLGLANRSWTACKLAAYADQRWRDLFRGHHADVLTGAVLTARRRFGEDWSGSIPGGELFGPPVEHGEDLSVRPTDGGRRGDDFRSYPKSAVRSQLAASRRRSPPRTGRRSNRADPR